MKIHYFLEVVFVGLCLFLAASITSRASELVSYDMIEKACDKYEATDCDLVKAIAWVENRYKNETVMDTGSYSYGMMQVKCDTARMMGLKFSCDQLNDPMINLRFAILYIEHQIIRYEGDFDKVVGAYNAGSYIRCVNGGSKCFPGEIVNHKYVYGVWRRYQWQRNKKVKISNHSLLSSKPQDGLERLMTAIR